MKQVYMTKRDFIGSPYFQYNNASCVNPIQNSLSPCGMRHAKFSPTKADSQNVGCQSDRKKDNALCACGNMTMQKRHTVLPGYEYFQASKSYTDIGIGSVKTLQRRKVKRIYLPETDERGVGSSDLTSFYNRRNKIYKRSYYDHKKTSSKCVGGVLDNNIVHSLSKKLSPIIHKKSGGTSPDMPIGYKNMEIGSNTIEKKLVTTTTQVETDIMNEKPIQIHVSPPDKATKENELREVENIAAARTEGYKGKDTQYSKTAQMKYNEPSTVFSSDSLLQRVHNLEIASEDKPSAALMENQLEKEYRKIFSMKSHDEKPRHDEDASDFKKESVLKRRFEALRRSLAKKDDQRKGTVISHEISSQKSVISRRDVSINSDPPSLEGRSYSNTKTYSPIHFIEQAQAGKSKPPYESSSNQNKDIANSNWSSLQEDSECQGVKGMFKLWGKKFNLEEDCYKKNETPLSSSHLPKKALVSKSNKNDGDKKDGKKYFFFKKKNKEKDKEKSAFKSKKGVTAGRCEVKEGLMMNMGVSGCCSEEIQEHDEILRKKWVQRFLTSAVDSKKSVKIRWNNTAYRSSSSTAFELMDNFYKDVVLRSRSDIVTSESSFYKSYTQQVNFVNHAIEAWMMPEMIVDNNTVLADRYKNDSNETRISKQDWIIEKSKAFAHTVEIVLHSENIFRVNEENSAAYLRIDIPNDFFANSSSREDDKTLSSDEEIYKIIEYETEGDLKNKNEVCLGTGDHDASEVHLEVSIKDSKNHESKILETVIKRPPKHRDAVIQGSDVYIPIRCDVIGVGIITQRELRDIRKPILKVQDVPETSDDDSDNFVQQNTKTCEFAESYLQEYYRHWIPLGIDFFNWCVSDSHLKGSNEISKTSFNNQGDGSKSCPNIYDDFQTSTSNDPCIPCGPCHPNRPISDEIIKDKKEAKTKSGFFKKRKKDKEKDDNLKRVLPKDSLEVFKKRQYYSCSNKSKWGEGFDCPDPKPLSVPSIQDKGAQDTSADCPPLNKSYCKMQVPSKPRSCKKHVSMPDCDAMNESLLKQLSTKTEGILAFKGSAGCDTCKKASSNTKHASVTSIVSVEDPCCINKCAKERQPPCEDRSPSHLNNTPSPKLKIDSRESLNLSKCCISPSPSQCSLGRQKKNPIIVKGEKEKRKPFEGKTLCPNSNTLSPGCDENKPRDHSKRCMSPSSLQRSPQREKKPQCPVNIKKEKHSPCENISPSSSHSNTPLMSPGLQSPKTLNLPKDVVSPTLSDNLDKQQKEQCSIRSQSCSSLELTKPKNVPMSPRKDQPNQELPTKIKNSMLKQTCSPRTAKKEKIRPKPCRTPKSPRSPDKLCSNKASGYSQLPKPQISPDNSTCGSMKLKKQTKPCVAPNLSNKVIDKLSPICPHFPPCFKTQCTQKSPTDSACSLANRKLAATVPNSPKKNKIVCEPKKCKTEPCSKLSSPKESNKRCEKKCELLPRPPLQTKNDKEKNCKPDCANRKRIENTNATRPTTACETPKTSKVNMCNSKSKISGIFLKMKPKPSNPKTCSSDCMGWQGSKSLPKEPNNMPLDTTGDIICKIKEKTPCPEGIAGPKNIKVKDEDGNTLYERIDYRRDVNKESRAAILGDMYKASINRVSTPININNIACGVNNDDLEGNDDSSILNLIEIQFKLKVTQGDKNTEVNINNEDINDTDNSDKNSQIYIATQNLYNLKDEVNNLAEKKSKNDVSIRILIKNYKPKIEKRHIYNEDFSQNIINKYNTVSTAHTDEEKAENTFSVHRTTVDLTSSTEKCKVNDEISNNLLNPQQTEKYPTNCLMSSENVYQKCQNDSQTKKENIEDRADLNSHTNDITEEHVNKLTNGSSKDANFNESNDNLNFIKKPQNRRDKIELLKKVLKIANETKIKTQESKKQLHDMLKYVLTSDSSANEVMIVTSNELTEDITYVPQNPNLLRDTDSMNNYYQIESSNASYNSKDKMYPTKESSEIIRSESEKGDNGCICSTLAERLKLCNIGGGCCCSSPKKKEEEILCDWGSEEDLSFIKDKEYVDIETQYSKYTASKKNSARMSMHSTDKSYKFNTSESIVARVKTSSKIREVTTVSYKKTFKKKIENEYPMKKFNRNTILRINDEDNDIISNANTSNNYENKNFKNIRNRDEKTKNKVKFQQASDVLQSYATKKAVLEIYAEKTVTNEGEKMVAKLPKFVCNNESDMKKFEKFFDKHSNIASDVYYIQNLL